MRVEDYFTILGFFKPGMDTSPEEVRAKISDLASFCSKVRSIDIDGYIRSTGEMSTARLEALRKTIVECSDYIVMHRDEITRAYLEGELDRWLLPESREALEKNPHIRELKVWDKILNDKLEIEYSERVFDPVPDELGCDANDEESSSGAYDVFDAEYAQACESQMDDPGYLEYLSTLHNSSVFENIGTHINNPLLDDSKTSEIKEYLENISTVSGLAMRMISTYLEWESYRSREPLRQIVLKMVPLIEDKVFKGPLDVDTLTNFLSLQQVPPPEIMPRKGNLCIQVLKVLNVAGPEVCRNDAWLETIYRELGIEGRLHNRKYEKPRKAHMKIISPLRKIVEEVTGIRIRDDKTSGPNPIE